MFYVFYKVQYMKYQEKVGMGQASFLRQNSVVSFICEHTNVLYFSTANSFLQLLAKETAGRYHRCHSDFDAQLFAHKLLTEGFDDAEVCFLMVQNVWSKF